MDFFIQMINGLGLGSIYALVALGYSMVYGIIQLINFAHGDIIMVGGYVVFVVMVQLGLPLWAAVILSIAVCTLLGPQDSGYLFDRFIDMMKGAK